MPAHQATCVAIAADNCWRAVLIEGPPGAGKTSLALALIDRGARLVGDDGVLLEPAADGRLVARPHPATRGLIEVRNLGILEMPVCDAAPVALVLRLDAAAPRYVEAAETVTVAGMALPMLRLWPGGAVLALRAELALSRYGVICG